MRIRPTTWAMLWYPPVCAVLAAGLGGWLWIQCGDARRIVACRNDILPGMAMFFLLILAAGMAVLLVVWLIGRLIGRRSADAGQEWSQAPSDPAGGTGSEDEAEPLIDSGSDSDPVRRG